MLGAVLTFTPEAAEYARARGEPVYLDAPAPFRGG
jgi:hypothetical protein